MPPSLHATVLMTLGSALVAVAVLRLAHGADLASTCYAQDDAFLSRDAEDIESKRSRWAVRASIQPWKSAAVVGPAVNLAQAAVLMVAAGHVSRGHKPGHPERVLTGAAAVLTVLAVSGDWELLRGACAPGVTPCGDAPFLLAANNCAYPPDTNVFGDPNDAVRHGCLVCDTTVSNMATAGLAIVATGVFALTAGNL